LLFATGSKTKSTTTAARRVEAVIVAAEIAKFAISGRGGSASMQAGVSSFTLTGRTDETATTEANGEGEKEADAKEKARGMVVVGVEKEAKGRAKASPSKSSTPRRTTRQV